jgi:hypothetical protein
MKRFVHRFILAEHFLLNSAFLLGLFSSIVDYLIATPLPAEWAHEAFFYAGFLRALVYAREQWIKSQEIKPPPSSSPPQAS